MGDELARAVYLPKDVATLLGVSPSTLRVYSSTFNEFLSSNARRDPFEPGPPFRHRRYTLDDVALLERVKAFLDAGLNYRQIRSQLLGQPSILAVSPRPATPAYRPPRRGRPPPVGADPPLPSAPPEGGRGLNATAAAKY